MCSKSLRVSRSPTPRLQAINRPATPHPPSPLSPNPHPLSPESFPVFTRPLFPPPPAKLNQDDRRTSTTTNRANAAKFTGAALQRRFEVLSIHLARQPGAAIFLPKPISKPISRRIFFAMSELGLLPDWVRCLGMNPLSGGGTRDLRFGLENRNAWDLDEIIRARCGGSHRMGRALPDLWPRERIEIRLRAVEKSRVIEWTQ